MYKYKIFGWNDGGILRNDLISLEVEADNEAEAFVKAKKLATRDIYRVDMVYQKLN